MYGRPRTDDDAAALHHVGHRLGHLDFSAHVWIGLALGAWAKRMGWGLSGSDDCCGMMKKGGLPIVKDGGVDLSRAATVVSLLRRVYGLVAWSGEGAKRAVDGQTEAHLLRTHAVAHLLARSGNGDALWLLGEEQGGNVQTVRARGRLRRRRSMVLMSKRLSTQQQDMESNRRSVIVVNVDGLWRCCSERKGTTTS